MLFVKIFRFQHFIDLVFPFWGFFFAGNASNSLSSPSNSASHSSAVSGKQERKPLKTCGSNKFDFQKAPYSNNADAKAFRSSVHSKYCTACGS